MEKNLYLIAAVVTIVGGGGIIGILKNKELIKSTSQIGRATVGKQSILLLHIVSGVMSPYIYSSVVKKHVGYFPVLTKIMRVIFWR